MEPAAGGGSRRSGAWQHDEHVRAALRAVPGLRAAAVRERERLDQGEPEPAVRLGPAAVGAAREPLERAPEELVGKAGTLVGHVQLDQLAVLPGAERDGAGAIAQGVGDEVVERLRGAIAVR